MQASQAFATQGEVLAGQYQNLMDGWAEVSKCCLSAADDIYQTSLNYFRDQAEQMHQMVCDPSSALREQTYTSMVSCGLDAADRIAHAYLQSLEEIREPLMRVAATRLPMSQAMSDAMERTLQAGSQFMDSSMQETERSLTQVQRGLQAAAQETLRSVQTAPQDTQRGMESASDEARRTMHTAKESTQRGAHAAHHAAHASHEGKRAERSESSERHSRPKKRSAG
jgi:hypothetical protein